MKVIEINDEGYVWQVPLLCVAEHRADYYEDDPDTTRQDEIDYVMSDDFEGIDWFANNMDFSDVADKATLVATPRKKAEPDINADKRIVEVIR